MFVFLIMSTADLTDVYRLQDNTVEGFEESGVPLRTFSPDDHSFSVKLPATWATMKKAKPDITLQMRHILGGLFFTVRSEPKEGLVRVELMELEEKSFEANLKKPAIEDRPRRELKIHGCRAIERQYHRGDVWSYRVVLETKTHFHFLVFSGDAAQFRTLLPSFESAAASFTPQEGSPDME